ncbi:phosphate ABC transporter substrate-binding protein [Spiroplasma diminutum]|uniref:Phosphate ABC transporter substrate-binding protein n=1 Tax=Spiroplasma diminutum CUAS-1 TaxID=1276221 RepID=S5LX37_9MOLU|nr:phosphate ABC transporter substrate-binding protein [Spiroplasma diminutum]AGR42379.1 phosphate ABC transporter substrate-binding protein [Spiroplasma diminutum CUAS-1]
MSRKISIILLICLSVILGLWIWSFAAPKKSIILGGSTSVNPFMQKLTKEYYDNEKIDFIYNSTGSQAGVGGVEKDMYSAGFISKDISSGTLTQGNTFLDLCNESKNECAYEGHKEQIKNNSKERKDSYVALEFAIDAIGIIYNAPNYWEEKITINNSENLLTLNDLVNFNLDSSTDSDKELLKKVYSGNMYWEDLAKELVKKLDNENAKNDFEVLISKQPRTKIVTFTREDGSGTRSAFSDLTGIKEMSTSNVVNSNGSMVENMTKSPSLGYVSNAFLGQLYEGGQIKLAGINDGKLSIGKDNDKPLKWEDNEWKTWKDNSPENNESLNEQFIKKVYEFKRPFIAIFNTHNNHLDSLLKLFDYFNDEKSNDVFKSEGLVKEMKFKSTSLGGKSW